MIQKNDKKIINGWCMYDWANSVYNLVITAAIFPIYYSTITTETGINGEILNNQVKFFGFSFTNTSLYSYAISASFLIMALLSPILSGIADTGGKKKMFLKFFAYLGSLCCCGLFFFERDTLELGILLSMGASIGFTGSLVFYNAYLPEISTEKEFDRVSAKGFGMGYAGSVILLGINLAFVMKPDLFGFPVDEAGKAGTLPTRFGFLLVGIWWMSFAQMPFRRLPKDKSGTKITTQLITDGINRLKNVYKELKTLKLTRNYLLSFFFYNAGVQAIMLLAASFGKVALNHTQVTLIGTIFVIQFLAIVGAYIFSFLAKKLGNITSIAISIALWVVVCLIAYFIEKENVPQFIGLAVLVGLMMGAIQSMSRSTYAKFIPVNTNDHTSYYSFYDVIEKFSVVIGTFVFAAVNDITNNMRFSALALAVFFIIGLILIKRIPSKHIYNTSLKK